MDLSEYFADVAAGLNRTSLAIRRDFASHRGSGGENRQTLLADELRNYLPRAFEIDTGLIASHDGRFSNQADLVITDRTWNAPFYPSGPNRMWLIEGVYAMIEVKTMLSKSALVDGIDKCRRFKLLPRQFSEAPTFPILTESLFIIFAFECPRSETVKRNLVSLLADVPTSEQPDFVVVPEQLVAAAGSYQELAVLGQPGSSHRQKLMLEFGPNLDGFVYDPIRVSELGQSSLFVWLLWLQSWLKRAGPRNPELLSYLPPNGEWGRVV